MKCWIVKVSKARVNRTCDLCGDQISRGEFYISSEDRRIKDGKCHHVIRKNTYCIICGILHVAHFRHEWLKNLLTEGWTGWEGCKPKNPIPLKDILYKRK